MESHSSFCLSGCFWHCLQLVCFILYVDQISDDWQPLNKMRWMEKSVSKKNKKTAAILTPACYNTPVGGVAARNSP